MSQKVKYSCRDCDMDCDIYCFPEDEYKPNKCVLNGCYSKWEATSD